MIPLYVGSIARQGPYFEARGEGLTVCAFDEETGTIARRDVHPEAANVLWLTKAGGFLWAACENYYDPGDVFGYAVAGDGSLKQTGGAKASAGGGICHVSVNPRGDTAFVSSYFGGVTLHSIDHGKISQARQTLTYPADGGKVSHPHQATLSPGGWLVVCDRGLDCLWIHELGSTAGPGRRFVPGADTGPRHLAWHPGQPCVSLLGEADATVRTYKLEGDSFVPIGSRPAFPGGPHEPVQGAAIRFHPSGKALFATDRGTHTVTWFAVGAGGKLGPGEFFAAAGNTPRELAFSPSGRWLLVVNQDSDEVVPFALDPATGIPTGHTAPPFAVGTPTCATF